MEITQEYLKTILTYNIETGNFLWKVSRGRAKAGNVAGWISEGHRFIKVLNLETTASRFVWLYHYGYVPDKHIEHINGDELDNRLENLSIVDHSLIPITADRLKSIIHYNPDTGKFTWLSSSSKKTRGLIGGYVNDQGYLLICVDSTKYRQHRLAWLYVYGRMPEKDIDHINGVRTDNRICNLREAEVSQNLANSKKPTTNKSGYKGVSWHRGAKKWQAHIKSQNINHYLGLFPSPEAAHEAYCEAAVRLNGAFARTD